MKQKKLVSKDAFSKIKVFVQSANGHDTIDATQASLSGIVKEQLQDDKWVTLEKKDGSTEILTKKDLEVTTTEEGIIEAEEPSDQLDEDDDVDEELDEEDKKLQAEVKGSGWDATLTGKATKSKTTTKAKTFESRFENVVSATATHKAKGG